LTDVTTRAIVLGAGGHAASSFEIGFIAGLADAGVNVRSADLFVGTSAGARVAVQLTSEQALEELFTQQIGPPAVPAAPLSTLQQLRKDLLEAQAADGSPSDFLRRIGKLALNADGDVAARRASVAMQLPVDAWPDRRMLLVTVEAETGERRAFDRTSGLPLTDAVAASGALPRLSPAIPFADRHYIDGGFYSLDNADLAAGYDRVLVLTLRAGPSPMSVTPVETTTHILERAGAQVRVIHPDQATQAVFAAANFNVLDPSIREPATRAAREYGRRTAGEGIAAFWQSTAS